MGVENRAAGAFMTVVKRCVEGAYGRGKEFDLDAAKDDLRDLLNETDLEEDTDGEDT